MAYTLSRIAQHIELDFQGEDITIEDIHTLNEATPAQLSFLHSKKYLNQVATTKAGAVLIEAKYADYLPASAIALITDEPYLKLAQASELFAYQLSSKSTPPKMGKNCDIDESVRFGLNVQLGDNVMIMAGCYLGDNVSVGSGTLLHPNVTLYHHTCVGNKCIIHSGTVVGSDGYGFAHTKQGEHVKIYQNGNVVIDDDVEIGACSSIDRAVFGSTRIQKGTKIDNLVQIGHNCQIGEYNLIVSQVGISGSTTTGRNVVMGGQSATAGHLEIGDFATIVARGGVTKSLEGGKTYGGFPAIDHKLWLRIQAKLSSLLKKKK